MKVPRLPRMNRGLLSYLVVLVPAGSIVLLLDGRLLLGGFGLLAALLLFWEAGYAAVPRTARSYERRLWALWRRWCHDVRWAEIPRAERNRGVRPLKRIQPPPELAGEHAALIEAADSKRRVEASPIEERDAARFAAYVERVRRSADLQERAKQGSHVAYAQRLAADQVENEARAKKRSEAILSESEAFLAKLGRQWRPGWLEADHLAFVSKTERYIDCIRPMHDAFLNLDADAYAEATREAERKKADVYEAIQMIQRRISGESEQRPDAVHS